MRKKFGWFLIGFAVGVWSERTAIAISEARLQKAKVEALEKLVSRGRP